MERSNMSNKVLVRALYEEVTNRREFERLPSMMSATFAREYENAVQILLAGFPDVRLTVLEIVGEEDRVVVRWRWKGRQAGNFRGRAPTGLAVENDGIVIYELAHGKLVRSFTINDRLGLLQTLGVVARQIGNLPVKPVASRGDAAATSGSASVQRLAIVVKGSRVPMIPSTVGRRSPRRTSVAIEGRPMLTRPEAR